MAKENLETKARKAVLSIEKKVKDMNNILYDLSMKLCHIIKRKSGYYCRSEGNDYHK
jgi:hypothetical protein